MDLKADILEDEILSTFGKEVLERLLRCHSRKYAEMQGKKATDNQYLRYHIVWATDDYRSYGDEFKADGQTGSPTKSGQSDYHQYQVTRHWVQASFLSPLFSTLLKTHQTLIYRSSKSPWCLN